MDTTRAFWVICITLAVVIVLNLGIYAAFSRRKPDSYSQLFGKVTHEMRNPWQQNNAALDELSKRVADLRAIDSVEEGAENQRKPETDG